MAIYTLDFPLVKRSQRAHLNIFARYGLGVCITVCSFLFGEKWAFSEVCNIFLLLKWLIILYITVLWKVVDKLCNPLVCWSHFIFCDLLFDIELYRIISYISYFLVHDNPELEYELGRFTYFDILFSRHILSSLEFERRKIMWFLTINNQVFTDNMAFKTFFELVKTNWNQVIELTFN